MARFFDQQQPYSNSGNSNFGGSFHSSTAFSRGDRRPDSDNYHQQRPISSSPSSWGSAPTSSPRGRYDYPPSNNNKSIAVLGLDPINLPPISKNFYQESTQIAQMTTQEVTIFRTKHEMSIQGREVPRPIATFSQAGFPSVILQKLSDDKFDQPTPIQAQGWPMALSGRNMVGIAQTGSGKTLSYILPSLIHLSHQISQPQQMRYDRQRICKPHILILAPTRELAIQIHEVARKYGSTMNCKSAVVFGGAPRNSQRYSLQNGVDLLIATPGRLIDFIKDRIVSLESVSYLVLDEADRMLDMGFEPQLREILPQIRNDRQVLMWSATWPKGVQKLARDLLGDDYIQVTIGSQELTANKKIKQAIRVLKGNHEKDAALAALLKELWDTIPGDDHQREMMRIIVFCNTKRDCDRLSYEMNENGWPAAAMHGDMQQFERENVLRDFRSGRRPIFICTDVAARGLDVKDVKAVVNYDFPKNFEDYIHRIGRTARGNDTEGSAFSFLVPSEDRGNARELIKLLREAGQPVPAPLEALVSPSNSYNNNNSQYPPQQNRSYRPPNSSYSRMGDNRPSSLSNNSNNTPSPYNTNFNNQYNASSTQYNSNGYSQRSTQRW